MDDLTRRRFLTRLASGLFVATLSREAFADGLQHTPWVTEGPFYPYHALPLDRDNDLVIVGKSLTPAVGTITHLGGTLFDSKGHPLKNALIEIWQVDGKGVYLAEEGAEASRDKHFQGYGRFETDAKGQYRFRTVKPVPYPGRTAPHIHVKVTAKGKQAFTTQLFIKGHPGNTRDGVYGGIGSSQARALVTREFALVKGSRIGELATTFNITLGATPQEGERGFFGPGGGPPPPPPDDRFGPPPGDY